MSNVPLKARLVSFKWAKIARIVLLKHLEHLPFTFNLKDID